MKNIETEMKGTILIIKVDLSKTFGPSKSGKTLIIASTEGNVTPTGADVGVKMGVNVYKGRG